MTPAEMPSPYVGPPLTVAYLGNFKHSFCTETHVVASLEILGHKVVRIQELPAQEGGTPWATIPGIVESSGAQLFMWTRTWPSEKSDALPVLDELRKLGVPSAFFHLDRWHGLDREHQVHDQPFAYCDVIFSPNNSPKWAEDGFNHFWLPPGVYGPECEPVPPNPRRWPYDVVFVGSHPYPHPEWAKYRSDLLAAFSRAFRGRFGILPRRGVPIRGRDLQELYSTVPVVLGDSCLAGESFGYLSDRCPESIGRGAFLIHPFVRGMVEEHPDAWYRHGQDIMGYTLGDFSGAVDIAKAALSGSEGWDRQRIASTGRATVLARDTYAHRMGTVLAVAEGIHGGYRDVPAFSPELNPPELEDEPPPLVVAAPTPRHSVQLHRWSAIFEPRPGTTDSEVIGEVWRNDYRVPPEGFHGGTVLEIGGNIGAFTVLAMKAGAGRVVVLEPDPDNRARLEHHLKLNHIAGPVTVLPVAASGRSDGTGHMVGSGGGARWVYDARPDGIPCLTLADLIDQYGPFVHAKVDCEGCCFAVFDAVPVEALSKIDTLSAEWHGPDGPPGYPGAPHLAHLTGEEFGPLVTKLADAGRVETFGHPRRGGLIHWRRYGA